MQPPKPVRRVSAMDLDATIERQVPSISPRGLTRMEMAMAIQMASVMREPVPFGCQDRCVQDWMRR